MSPISDADALYRPFPSFEEWKASSSIPVGLWERFASTLNSEREASSEETRQRALRFAVRAAAIDTGAIEGLYETDRGFTYSVAAEEAAWQSLAEEKGPDTIRLFEAQLEALDLVIDAATQETPISEAWIRRLHEVTCAAQETYKVQTPQGPAQIPLPKGEYKMYPNHVTLADGSIHAYAPVHATPAEMQRLVSELRSEAFRGSHPLLQAAYAHYALVAVHPFADGNGRVARALASVFLFRSLSIPLVIYADQRLEYFDSLALADLGHRQPFVSFMFDRAIDTMGDIAQALRTARQPPIEESLSALRRLEVGHSDLPHQELDNVASRVLQLIQSEIDKQLSDLPDMEGQIRQLQAEVRTTGTVPGYRNTIAVSPTELLVRFVHPPPASAEASFRVKVAVAVDLQLPFAFVVQRVDPMETLLEIRLRDVFPGVTLVLTRRIATLVQGLIAESGALLSTRALQSLRQSGFRG